MADVTSRHIMKAAGIKNIATLTRWHQKGLIPPPEVCTHPNGRGKMAYWPQWVLHRCVRITQLRKAGKRLSEIKELLGDDWEAESRKFTRRYRFIEVSQRMDRENALRSLSDRLYNLFIAWHDNQKKRPLSVGGPFIPLEVLENALELTEQGTNAVLIFTQSGVHATADFMVSEHLAQLGHMNRLLLVIPISDEIRDLFRDQMVLSPKTAVRPVKKVLVSSDGEEQERRFEALEDWSFEIGAPECRRKRGKKTDGT